MAYTDGQNETLMIVNILCSSFSILGGLFIITTYCLFAKMKRMAYQLVVFVAISDLIRSIGNVFGNPDPAFVCSLQGFLKNFGGVSSFLWILAIALVMYSILFKSSMWENPNVPKMLLILGVVVHGVALIVSLIPIFYGSYIQLSAWCWIGGRDNTEKALRWASFYGWLLAVFFSTSIIYGIIIWKVRSTEAASSSPRKEKRRDKMFDRIKYYPLILIGCYLFGVVRRLINTIDEDYEIPYWVAFIHVFFSSLYGLMNALLYGLTPRVKKEWKKQIREWRENVFGVNIMKGGTTGSEDVDTDDENGQAHHKTSDFSKTDVSTF